MREEESGRSRRRGTKASHVVSSADQDIQAAGHRHARLQHILHEELNALLRGEVKDPRLGDARITAVVLSSDYHCARVRFALGTPEVAAAGRVSAEAFDEASRAFAAVAGFLRARVAEALDLKRVPNLRFVPELDAVGSAGGEDPWWL